MLSNCNNDNVDGIAIITNVYVNMLGGMDGIDGIDGIDIGMFQDIFLRKLSCSVRSPLYTILSL